MMQDTGCMMLDAGCWVQNAGFWVHGGGCMMQGAEIQYAWSRVQGAECRALGAAQRVPPAPPRGSVLSLSVRACSYGAQRGPLAPRLLQDRDSPAQRAPIQGPPGTGCTHPGTPWQGAPCMGHSPASKMCTPAQHVPTVVLPAAPCAHGHSVRPPVLCAHLSAVSTPILCTPICVQPLHGVHPVLYSAALPPPPALQLSGCPRLAAGSRAPGCFGIVMPPPPALPGQQRCPHPGVRAV